MCINALLETKKYKSSSASVRVGDKEKIINVVPSDFDHDGFLDLFVMSVDSKADPKGPQNVVNQIYYGNGITLSTRMIH